MFSCVKHVNESRKTTWRVSGQSSTHAQKNIYVVIKNVYNQKFSQNNTLRNTYFLPIHFLAIYLCYFRGFTHFPQNLQLLKPIFKF